MQQIQSWSRDMARWPVLKVENYGPVKRAELELRPLTVLVGKNNTGKSYLASLIYTIGDALSGPQVLLLSMFPRSDKVKIIKNIIKDRVVPYVEKAVRWRAEKLMIILQASINLSITISRQDHVNVEVEIGKELEDYLEEHLKELEGSLEEEEELWGFSVWRPGTVLNSPIYLLAERAGILRVYRPILATYVRTT
ncbi:MAG TPA: hypothetical protein ENF78_00030, partial [Candidatus Bathyarchaeota archaeon]|nr:hypothetical protein [Candidatus Bathyarchaeota archaeon]